MHIPILSLRIPWVGYIEFGWQTLLVASVLGFVVYRCGRLGIAYELRRAGLESSRRAAISLAAYDLPSMKKLAAESDPEIDHDREWVSACSVAVDRDIVSVCFALDAVDRNWPWETVEVRKALARESKCRHAMSDHISAAYRRYDRFTHNSEQLAEQD